MLGRGIVCTACVATKLSSLGKPRMCMVMHRTCNGPNPLRRVAPASCGKKESERAWCTLQDRLLLVQLLFPTADANRRLPASPPPSNNTDFEALAILRLLALAGARTADPAAEDIRPGQAVHDDRLHWLQPPQCAAHEDEPRDPEHRPGPLPGTAGCELHDEPALHINRLLEGNSL